MENSQWVKARSECSLKSFFQMFSEVIDYDVKPANDLKRTGVAFRLNRDIPGKLIVTRDRDLMGFEQSRSVVIELLRGLIRATEAQAADPVGKPMFSAIPILNDDGECLVEVDKKQLKMWQLSRLALEDLFFRF